MTGDGGGQSAEPTAYSLFLKDAVQGTEGSLVSRDGIMTEDLALDGKFGANDIEWMSGNGGKSTGKSTGEGGKTRIGMRGGRDGRGRG